jgi:methylated-DNA-[protein]-cysteine S-methyltransferase
MLRGQHVDFTDIALDMQDIPPFGRRVHEFTRTIPRCETRTYDEVARALRITGAAHSVAQVMAKNPYMIIVPCHRVLEAGRYADRMSAFGGSISKRRLLSLEGTAQVVGKTLFDVLLPVAAPRPHN